MQSRAFGQVIVVALACVILFPLAASAQSSFAGLVRDESGGVLPGVTVEAASPVLIEKVRTGITDDQGRFRIVDLRPGTYTMTFTMAGFATVVRDGVVLAANFTATVNADMKVGALQESVTVSGEAPMVDVQQVSRTQDVTREIVDALPTTRDVWSIGILVPGIRAATPNVGGSYLEQTGQRAHGINSSNTEQLTDSVRLNSNESDNCCMAYVDEGLAGETSVMTSAIPADTGWGGIRINMIPKDGGNVTSGTVFLGGSKGSWMSNNINDALRKKGMTIPNGVLHIQNFSATMGGPVWRDKLWYFLSTRHMDTDQTMANEPLDVTLPSGEHLRVDSLLFVRDVLGRLTWQATPKNKFGAWWERTLKRRDSFNQGADPRSAELWDTHPVHGGGTAKWTSTISSKLLLEATFGTRQVRFTAFAKPGFYKTPFTPDWYAFAGKTDTAYNKNFPSQSYDDNGCGLPQGCTVWGPSDVRRTDASAYRYLSALSYVTGTHNIKAGFQLSRGPVHSVRFYNADLIQNFVNNVAQSVSVYNTPMFAKPFVDGDLGVYVQDSWTLKRLTINPGIRANWFKSEVQAASEPAGRFVPARYFPAQKDLPNWGPDWTPRLSAAYDLFGDGKTALKVSYSKYMAPWTGGYASRYGNAILLSETRNWYDTDLIPGTSTRSGVVLPTNGDGIAQDNEIGPSSSGNFGTRADRNPAPNLRNFYNWETTASVQHQVGTGTSVSASYFRRVYKNIHITDRGQITNADFTSFTTTMPDFSQDPSLSGILDPTQALTIYNLNPAKLAVYNASQVDYNSTGAFSPDGQTANTAVYNGVELSFSTRLEKTTLSASWTAERFLSRYCDYNDDPNGVSVADLYGTATTLTNGGLFCDQSKFSIPFKSEFKLMGSYQLPFGVDFGSVLQSYPGQMRTITWSVPASLFPGGRTQAETVVLNKPGSVWYPRYTQFDINFRKAWRHGRNQWSLQLDYFNVLNGNAIRTQNNAIGSSLGQVTAFLQGRLPRIAFQFKW